MHRVLYNEGAQTLYFAPRDRHGRPSVATTPKYTIADLRHPDGSSDRTVQTQATADPSSETEPTVAAAGYTQADATRIDVSDASDFTEGREYLIQAADGQRESFILWRKDTSNNYLYARDELTHEYAIGSTVRAFELRATFPAAEANDETEVESGGGPYQVVWEYTIDGVLYLTPEIVWLTRYSVAPMLTESEVLIADPLIARSMGGIVSVSQAIAAATQDFVGELEAVGKDPSYFRATNAGKLAVRFKTLEYLRRWRATDRDDERADRYSDLYEKHVGNLITGRPPHGTVDVHPAHDDAEPGTNTDYGFSLLRRS